MEKSKQWYILYTKAGLEQKVCEALRRKKLDHFHPVTKMTTQTSYGKEKILIKPLFERYVFVSLAENELEAAKHITGVLNLVHWLLNPIIICQDDIYLLKRFFNMHDDIRLEKTKVNPIEPASTYTSVSNEGTDIVHFSIPVLGCVMTAQESRTTVKVITVSNQKTKTTSTNQYAKAR